MAKWCNMYCIYEDETEDDGKIQYFQGPKEWRTVYKIIREYEATGESATNGRPIRNIDRMVFDEDGGHDAYYEYYRIIDGKIVWKTEDGWRWEDARQ